MELVNRLTYFDVRGRVEPIRLMLEAREMKYEFVGVQLMEWKETKPKIKVPYFSYLFHCIL